MEVIPLKVYVKPRIGFVNLRPEEGLACYGSYEKDYGCDFGDWNDYLSGLYSWLLGLLKKRRKWNWW